MSIKNHDATNEVSSQVLKIQVPSLHDGTSISCRVHLPDGPLCGDMAIVAHPYGPLGGSQDDSVVNLAVREFIQCGYVVATFDFRKWPSWTLKPEIADYSSVVVFLLWWYAARLRSRGDQSTLGAPDERQLKLVIAGYSYGSLVASQMPTLSNILQAISPEDERYTRIDALAKEHVLKEEWTTGIHTAIDITSLGPTRTSYLLISPLLSPTALLLAPLARRRTTSEEQRFFAQHKALAVFGTEDTFTSSSRLESWAQTVGIETCIVRGSNHFWRDPTSVDALQTSIAVWTRSLTCLARPPT